MRVVVALENRFVKTRNGDIYSTTVCDYSFWRRYLQVFDEVLVFARVAEIPENQLDKPSASGPNVSFLPLPTFIGPWQYLREYSKLQASVKSAVDKADAFILRVPGAVCTLLWHYLRRRKIPYGVEVVTDPWLALAPGGVRTILRPILRQKMRWELARQCRMASVASYVTEHTLQKRYPPGGWSTHYSSVELRDEDIIDEKELAARLASINDVIVNKKRPLKICHMGSMSVLWKGQDILIEAVSLCRKKGLDIQLFLLGEGQYYQYYLDRAKKLGLEKYVKFLGQLPPGQAVIKQLDAADLFVLPTRSEGLPRCIIQAMARGLPCLASNISGIPELLADEDLFPPRNAIILAERIDSLFTDGGKIGEMAQRNLQTAKKYCTDELNRRRRALYQKLKEKTEEWYSKGYQK